VQTIDYKNNLVANTFRGPSDALWADAPVLDILENPGKGMYFFDDFIVAGNAATANAIGNFGHWASWVDTNGVLGTDPQQEGGVILLSDGGNTTVNLTLGSTAGAFRLVSPASLFPLNPSLWFECRVAVGSITTAKRDVFIGLSDNTNQTTASAIKVIATTTNTLATINNIFGFHFRSTTNPTDVGLAFNVAGGTVQYPTALQTLSLSGAAATFGGTGAALTAFTAGATGLPATGFIKLGFRYNPFAVPMAIVTASSGQTVGVVAKALIQVFVNGLPMVPFLTSANLQAATFPTGYMSPVISYTSRSGTSAGGLYVDWIRCCQGAQL